MSSTHTHEADAADPRLADVFDECSFWCARFGEMLIDELELPRDGAIVLDVDCGTGFPMLELACRCGAACRFVGVDLWPEALRRAELKRDFHGQPNVLIARADSARLPVADASIDLIIMNLGINNFADPPAVLRDCARVCRRGGRFALTTNCRGCYREFYDLFQALLIERGLSDALPRLQANIDHRGSRESLTAALSEAGFGGIRAAERECVMRFADAGAMMRHPLVRLGFLDGWRAVIGADRWTDILAELQRRLNDISARDGVLRMTAPMLYLESRREP